jgi:hypothetical protein
MNVDILSYYKSLKWNLEKENVEIIFKPINVHFEIEAAKFAINIYKENLKVIENDLDENTLQSYI